MLFGNETMYKYCHQNLIFPNDGLIAFPVLSSWQGEDKWMTKDQELTTNIFGIASTVVLAVVLLKFLWSSKKYYVGFFRGNYEVIFKTYDYYYFGNNFICLFHYYYHFYI